MSVLLSLALMLPVLLKHSSAIHSTFIDFCLTGMERKLFSSLLLTIVVSIPLFLPLTPGLGLSLAPG